ncbi:hypothetical protein CLV41_1011061 [Roseibium marinum]|uniref:Uncharacterized protein n=1 Tax=Roseibium marinum TaxID=281252 RepID=A0A2S3V3W3_9HYPH|nr:hypothetical protein CLV41_1011061 [Roseibium marinum]
MRSLVCFLSADTCVGGPCRHPQPLHNGSFAALQHFFAVHNKINSGNARKNRGSMRGWQSFILPWGRPPSRAPRRGACLKVLQLEHAVYRLAPDSIAQGDRPLPGLTGSGRGDRTLPGMTGSGRGDSTLPGMTGSGPRIIFSEMPWPRPGRPWWPSSRTRAPARRGFPSGCADNPAEASSCPRDYSPSRVAVRT